MGRALLAARNVPDQQLGGYLRHLPADRAVQPERLIEVLTDARRLGYAVELGENEPDVACIGTALFSGPGERSGSPHRSSRQIVPRV